jgi:hypothetical protein
MNVLVIPSCSYGVPHFTVKWSSLIMEPLHYSVIYRIMEPDPLYGKLKKKRYLPNSAAALFYGKMGYACDWPSTDLDFRITVLYN